MTSFYSAKIWQEGKRGPPPIFASIGELQRRMHSSVARLEPRGLSMLAYALARMKGFEDPVLLTAVLDRSVTKMPDFGPTDAAKRPDSSDGTPRFPRRVTDAGADFVRTAGLGRPAV
eukprot:g6343.t1